jgi:hypothetical protein
MKIAPLTIYQFRELYQQSFSMDSLFNPTALADGTYFISEEEINQYQGTEFAWVKDLVLIDYTTSMPDTTAPSLLPYAVEIPTEFQWVFVGDKITIGGFYIPLDDYQNLKVVNLAYFNWAEFRAELDSGKYADLKSALMPLWDYVDEQVTNNNIIIL